MEDSFTETIQGSSPTIKSIKISKELEEAFDALPDGGPFKPAKEWTAEEDAILLKYWPIKKHSAVAIQLGVAENTARKRYRELNARQ